MLDQRFEKQMQRLVLLSWLFPTQDHLEEEQPNPTNCERKTQSSQHKTEKLLVSREESQTRMCDGWNWIYTIRHNQHGSHGLVRVVDIRGQRCI